MSDAGDAPDESVADHGGETLVVALVSGSHFVNHAYLVLIPPLLPALSREFGVGVAAVGLAVGIQGAVNAGMQLPFGHVSDTRTRSLVLLVSLSVGAVGAGLTAIAPTFGALLGAQVVLGIGTGAHHPAHYPLLAAGTRPERRARAYSVHGFAGALGFAAPPVVVALAGTLGLGWRVAVVAITGLGVLYALVAFVAVRWVAPAVRRGAAAGSRGDLSLRGGLVTAREAVASVLASPPLVTLALLSLVTSAAAWGIRAYALVLLTDGYGIAPDAANFVVSGMFVVGAVTILAGGSLADRIGSDPVLLGGYGTLAALAVVVASLLIPPVLALGCTLLLTACIGVSRPARSTLADALSASEDLGKSFGLVTIGITGGGALAPPVFGFVVERAGIDLVFFSVAGLAVLALGLTVALTRFDGARTLTGVVSDD